MAVTARQTLLASILMHKKRSNAFGEIELPVGASDDPSLSVFNIRGVSDTVVSTDVLGRQRYPHINLITSTINLFRELRRSVIIPTPPIRHLYI
jgi:hypothetical protein